MRRIISYEPQSNRSINHVKRQYSKSDLASLVEDAATNPCESVRRHASQQRMSLTSKDVLQLLYPTPQVDERVDERVGGGKSGGESEGESEGEYG